MENQIKAGAALNYVIIGINALVGLLYTPYMLRMLGQNEYGLFSLVASVISYLTILDFVRSRECDGGKHGNRI